MFLFHFPSMIKFHYQNGHHFLLRAVQTLNSPLKSCLVVLKEILCLLFNATLFRVYFRLAVILVSCKQNTIAFQLPWAAYNIFSVNVQCLNNTHWTDNEPIKNKRKIKISQSTQNAVEIYTMLPLHLLSFYILKQSNECVVTFRTWIQL